MSSATRLSRIAGPVCITRLAMRPAKSFWKNAQDWRTTCQWFCQRMRLATLAAIAWFISRCCATKASGRSTSSTAAMPSEHRPGLGEQRLPACVCVISVTTWPMKTGIGDVEQRDDEAGREQRDEQALGLAGEVPIERDEARRRLGRAPGTAVGLQRSFEQAEHRVIQRARARTRRVAARASLREISSWRRS